MSILLHFIDTDRQDPRVIVLRVTCRAALDEREAMAALRDSICDWAARSGEGKEAVFNCDGNLNANRLIDGDLDSSAFRRALARNKLERVEILACFGLMSCHDATASFLMVDSVYT